MFRKRPNKNLIQKHRSPMDPKELFIWGAALLSLFIKCMIFQYGTGLNNRPFFSSANINMYISTLSLLIIAGCILYILFNRHRLKALSLFYLIVTALVIADTIYFRYYDAIISIPVIANMNFTRVRGVNDSIQTLFQWRDIVYLADIPILILLYRYLKKNKLVLPVIRKRMILSTVSVLLAVSLFGVSMYRAELKAFAFSGNYATKDLGVLYAHIDSTLDYTRSQFEEDRELTEEEIEEIREYYQTKTRDKGPDTGIAQDMNIIIIMAEAIQGFLIGMEIDGVEVTPNLNRLAREGLYFDNIYYQTAGGNTSDAEFLQYTSLYPMASGSVFHERTDYYFPSFPMALNDMDYNTYALHAFQVDYWNRHHMYEALAFDTYVDYTYYEMDEYVGWKGQALSDESFFRQSLEVIDTENPFYASFITLSSHYPFSYFTDFPFNTGEYEGTFISDYIKGSNYADHAIGLFIEDLKARDLYDNSLLVVFGDHSGVPRFQSENLLEMLSVDDNNYTWMQLQKVPLIINHPNLEPQVISKVAGQVDILPTIANLAGVEVPFAMGNDILGKSHGYALLRNGSLITEDYIYVNDTRELFDYHTGEYLELEDYQEEINDYLYELYISDLIVEGNGILALESMP